MYDGGLDEGCRGIAEKAWKPAASFILVIVQHELVLEMWPQMAREPFAEEVWKEEWLFRRLNTVLQLRYGL